MKKQYRRRKMGKRNPSTQAKPRHRRLSSLESLEVRNLLAADIIFGPGTNIPNAAQDILRLIGEARKG